MWSDIDKEALESRNPYSIPDTDHQGADKENPRLVDSCKHGKRHQQADRRTDRYPMNLPMIDQPTGDQPRRPHSYRHINKEIARIGHFYFLSVQNDKRSNHPIRNCNQDISERSRQCLHQDKTVEGKMRPRNLFSLRIADQADRTDPDKSSHPTNKDNQIKPTFPIDGNSCQRSQRHRQIDCQTVKPHSFTTPGGRDHINRNRIAGNRSQPHKTTLNETDSHNSQHGRGNQIPAEHESKNEEGEKI